MGRLVAVDYGTRRIGLALADSRGIVVTPADVLDAAGSASKDAVAILVWATENEAAGIIVGLPLNMDGTNSAQTMLARRLAAELRKHGTLPVELWDERLSSFEADHLLDAAAVRKGKRKKLRDALAAQVILQSYLAAQRAREDADEIPPIPPE